jgi:hypothetical protein
MAKLETILNWSVEEGGHNDKGQKWPEYSRAGPATEESG